MLFKMDGYAEKRLLPRHPRNNLVLQMSKAFWYANSYWSDDRQQQSTVCIYIEKVFVATEKCLNTVLW